MVNAKRLKDQCIDLFKMEEDILGYEQMVLEHYKAALEPYETIALWGTGADGRLLYDFIEEVVKDKDIFFIDNEKSRWNKPNYKNVMCYGVEHVYGKNSERTIILIASSFYASEIMRGIGMEPVYGAGYMRDHYLTEHFQTGRLYNISVNVSFVLGMRAHHNRMEKLEHKREILQVMELFSDDASLEVFWRRVMCHFHGIAGCMNEVATYPQYFPIEIKDRFTKDEVFLDCGASYGDTVRDFRRETGDQFKKIYSFEMDADTCKRFEDNVVTHDERVVLIEAGVSNETRTIKYQNTTCASYATKNIDEYNLLDGKLVAVDELIHDGRIKEKVTYVKMDIEGAELDALHGMEKMIKSDKPKLAISIYHKPEDLWEIPLYIYKLVPEYKFILRHHHHRIHETILYAYL